MSASLSPSSATLGPVPLGTSAVAQLVATNEAGGPPVSARVTGDGFALLAEVTVAPCESATVYVEYAASSEGEHRGTLELVEQGTSTVVASASLSGTTTASLSVGASSLDFGSVLVGATGVTTLSVTNSTGASLTLSPAAPFTVDPTQLPSTGIPQQLFVRFDPTAATAYSASLAIGSETVTLSGTGIEDSDAEALEAAASAQATADAAADATQYTSTSDTAGSTRYKVEVPYDTSRLYLGRGVSDSSLQTYIDGCGLDTDSNVYLHARSGRLFGKAGDDIVLWSDGGSDDDSHVWLHNNGSGSSILSSRGTSYLSGEGGVVVTAGLPLDGSGSGIAKAPDTAVIDTMATIFTALDIAVGVGLAVDAIKSTKDDWDSSGYGKRGLEIFGSIVAAGAPIVGICGAAGALPGATIFGAAGVSIFSPAYTAIYGVGGIGLISLYPTMFAVIDATIWAIDDVNITGSTGNVNLNAGSEINVHASSSSGGKVAIEASTNAHGLGGAVTVHGGDITIGSSAGVALTTPITQSMSLGAVSVEHEAVTGYTITLGASEISIDALGVIKLKAGPQQLVLSPTAGISITATNTVSVGAPTASLELSAGKAELTAAAATLEASGTQIKMKQGASELGLAAAKITAKGNWSFS
ncbi:MAG: hypothetical protein VYE22_27485 [Myxococcota bacterium]|nr:hypothetical protein [Myxococcota bacterium]